MDKLTPKQLAEKVAEAWNRLDATLLKPLFAPNFIYLSLGVSNPITSADEYVAYLQGKFNTFKRNNTPYNADIFDINKTDAYGVVLHTPEYEDNPPMFVIECLDGQISRMIMRTMRIYSVNDMNNPETLYYLLEKQCRAIHRWVEYEVQRLGFPLSELEWYQPWPILNAPSTQHLCFRLGNNVYSLKLYIYGQCFTDEADKCGMLGNIEAAAQTKMCENNDMITCDVYIDVNSMAIPTIYYADSDQQVELSMGEEGEVGMSMWEINAAAINMVLDVLRNHGAQNIEYTNVLGLQPQIFYIKDGKKYYVYIEAHPDQIPGSPINIDLVEGQPKEIVGQFVNIALHSDSLLIPRRGQLLISSGDIEVLPIEEAMEKYRTARLGFI